MTDPVETERDTDYRSDSIIQAEAAAQYRIAGLLARGGMGVVYEANDLNTGRPVAVKLLSGTAREQERERATFVEEARITAKLEHPNIVPVHEMGQDARGNLFYVMKFVGGATLTDVLTGIREGRAETIEKFPLARLLTTFQKACDAVAFAHSRNIIHCDLKPGNIMIGEFGEVLVVDWGLAQEARTTTPDRGPGSNLSASANATIAADLDTDSIRTDKLGTGLRTKRGNIVGTPSFMAPEQITGPMPLDERTDIYALGALLYALLTLRVPVTGKDVHDVLRRIVAGELIPLTDFDGIVPLPHCPDGRIPFVLGEIARKAMSVDPDGRYRNVREMQEEVEQYQDGMVWHLLLDERFEEGRFSEHWDIPGGEYELRDGELRLHGGVPQLLLLKRDVPGDVRIDFDCRLEGADLHDLGCFLAGTRSSDPRLMTRTGYELKVGACDNTVNVVERYGHVIWRQEARPLAAGTTYHLRAERVGASLRLTVNNEEVFHVTDPDPISGPDHTAAGILGWMSGTRFSRIRVYTLGTPWKSDILEVAERHLRKAHYQTAMDLFQEVMDSFPDSERLERARVGFQAAKHCEGFARGLAEWRLRLQKAWGGARFELHIENGDLALEIPDAGIEDLAPVAGLPLTTLNCSGNRIRSLEPLRGMELEILFCSGNPLTSLEPLRGMPLTMLYCDACGITSLEPLRGMLLAQLSCARNPLGDGLEPLRSIPLTWLSCVACGVNSLEPLRQMPLKDLNCDANGIESVEPLRGMDLVSLSCSGNRISSLEPLRGMPLHTLHCGMNAITDLEPLRDMPLAMLRCQCNQVRTLEPLRGMSLSMLLCGDNAISDIGCFVKKPPKTFLFDCSTLERTELEWIRRTWSQDFRYADHLRNLETLLAARANDLPALRNLTVEHEGRRYLFVPRFLHWEEAETFSRKMGGHLLTILTKEENDFIARMFPTDSWFWLGLRRTEGRLEWSTGQPVRFRAFADKGHEESPGPKVFSGGAWMHDSVENARNAFVIQWDN